MAVYHVEFDIDLPDPIYAEYIFWRNTSDNNRLHLHSPVFNDGTEVTNVSIVEVVTP